MPHRYAIRYDVKIEDRMHGYTKEEANDCGLTDGLVIFSILFLEDGSYSQCIVKSANGKEKRCFTQNEIFKLWLTLGMSFREEDLSGWRPKFIKQYKNIIREMFKQMRKENINEE